MLNSVETIETINSLVKNKSPLLFIISFEGENNIVLPLNQLESKQIFFQSPGSSNIQFPNLMPELLKFNKLPLPFSDYQVLFNKVMREIQKGNSFLLNLTVPTKIETNLNLYELFLLSKARYKLYFQNQFTLFSPESFISIDKDVISTFPMKGTIRADVPNALETIINDLKETAEHATIVDLLRNDLSIVATEVKVKRYRYHEIVKTNYSDIYQISSEIQGKLPHDYESRLGEILFSLLPAGSVTGAPKKKTVSIINNVELCPRNYYTGIFGTWHPGKLESAVMIRFIRNENGTIWYHSGGGITFQSDCQSEYNELIDKVYVPVY